MLGPKEIAALLAALSLISCTSLEETRVSNLIRIGAITAKPSESTKADYEVVIPTLWGNGYDSDDPQDRRWFVKEVLKKKRLCSDSNQNFEVVGETKNFSHADEDVLVGTREYYNYYVYVACRKA